MLLNYIEISRHLAEGDDGGSEMVERDEAALEFFVANAQLSEESNQLWRTSTTSAVPSCSGRVA